MEFTTTATKYLRACQINIQEAFLKQQMLSHPDYPSLLSLTDTLDELNIEYAAIEVDKEKVSDLNFPLLAHINRDFTIISSLAEVDNNRDSFMMAWDGITVMVQQGSSVQNKEHDDLIREQKFKQQKWFAVITGIIILYLVVLVIHFNLNSFLFALLGIAGIGICSLIILHAMGKDNKLIEQLCNADGTKGCDKVLQSKVGKLGNDITLGEAGLLYFTGTFLFQLISIINNNISTALTLLLIPTTLSLAFTLFSLYYQWHIIKSWCPMCLIVVGIIWSQATVLMFFFIPSLNIQLLSFNTEAVLLLIPSTLLLVISCFFVSSLWLFIKPLLVKAGEAEKKTIELLKWKRNSCVFLSLLFKQRKVDVKPWEEDIILGNPGAAIQVHVACNPYCGPCAKAHAELEELVASFSEEVGITIRFVVKAGEGDDNRTIAIKHILAACYSERSKESGKHAVNAWYQHMNLAKFNQQYKTEYKDNFDDIVKRSEYWSDQARITHTPTIFVNGYEMPKQYKIKDLQLLIPTIKENITLIPVARETV